jgi:hypothetical protein
MSDHTPRFALPYILPGQAQKELTHNEALAALDAALHPVVEGSSANPPANAAVGQSWIVAAGATDAWTGEEGKLATWTDGGWRFTPPPQGMAVWSRPEGFHVHFLASGWSQGQQAVASLWVAGKKVVGERQPAVPSPSGGTTIDAEARAAIASLTAALKSHGLTD